MRMKTLKLEDITPSDRSAAGEKAYNLSLLVKGGFDVPEAFVITGRMTQDWDLASAWIQAEKMLPVAVRSSSSVEDRRHKSNAGCFPSHLNISDRKNFFDAVKDIASYGTEKHPIGILVQRMVKAQVSGVCFTQDPLTPGKALVEASTGPSDDVTSGKVNSVAESIPLNESGGADLYTKVEEKCREASYELGFEADVEWAIDDQGKFWFLQARPITATQHGTENLDTQGDFLQDCFTASNVQEMLPGALTPMTQKIVVGALDLAMRHTLESIGVYDEDELSPGKGLACFNGHAYFDLTTIYAMEKKILGATKEGVNLTIIGQSRDDLPGSDLDECSLVKKAESLLRYLKKVIFTGRCPAKANAALKEMNDYSGIGDLESQVAEFKKALPLFDRIWEEHHLTTLYAGSLTGTLTLISRDQTHDEKRSQNLVASALSGVKTKNAAIAADLVKIREKLDLEGVKTADAEQLLSRLQDSRHASSRLYKTFLEKYGHRSAREGELASVSWRMNPLPVAQGLIDIRKPDEDEENEKKEARKDAVVLLKKDCDFWEKTAVRYLIKAARKGLKRREETRDTAIKAVDILRRRLISIGRSLVNQGNIQSPDDVFYLLPEELDEAVENPKADFSQDVSFRRRNKIYQESLRMPQISLGIPRPKVSPEEMQAEKLTGTAASRGKAQGRAFVVRSPEDYHRIEEGDIVVSEYADTGLIPFMPRMGGLVTELGSLLSHACVVARELSLPVLVGVKNATDIIESDDSIIMDADQGTILKIDE